MGYTHYWYRPEEIPVEQMRAIVEDFNKIVPVLGVKLGDWEGKDVPVITEDEISFNGFGEDSFETVSFDRILSGVRLPIEPKGIFQFCKTGYRPYDVAVTSFLIVAKHHLGDRLAVSSDGEDDAWSDGKMICASHLGYGQEYEMTRQDGLVKSVLSV
jgi:hypothetical protein